ncbi:rod shape-determining protein MreD [Bacillus sp. FJAT-50079]|uniref:rod shape-determining protein MreD n=1 Tax=Bacillus sp. FJAT-50079 TaxID=2833577 RepID=UPI001BC9A93A|nr:rod shape-determining protein MreD [Bacillus sp. FJAT-50079]MBS4208962.1 rod shape-determining protein MreD [Bacillus sp. FJAT-50079]
MKRIILPLFFILAFYGESLFVNFTPHVLFGEERHIIPHFILVLLMMTGIYYFRNQALLYALLFGLLFDVYYTGTIGIYLCLYPIAVYLTTKMIRILHVNILTTTIVITLHLAIVELLVYAFAVLVLRVSMPPAEFASLRLWPTLICNAILCLIIYFPFSRWLQSSQKEKLAE